MKSYHKKPAGKLNLYKLTSTKREKLPNTFPDIKDQQEIKIVELFLELTKTHENIDFDYESFHQNGEQDLDFTIVSKKGNSLLELTELMPSDNMKGGYENVSSEVNQQALVNRLIKIIEKKSQKYVGIKMPIDLLVYITNDNSNPSVIAEQYLKNYLSSNKHAFRNIFFFIPFLTAKDGIILKFYPNNQTGENLPPLGSVVNIQL